MLEGLRSRPETSLAVSSWKAMQADDGGDGGAVPSTESHKGWGTSREEPLNRSERQAQYVRHWPGG